jgi:hypothetical protein
MLRKDGVAEPIPSLTTITGQKFLKRVGPWLVLCGNEPATSKEEHESIKDFTSKILSQTIACDHFPVFCYMGPCTLDLQ